ncbi:3-oxoacyl-[acyl-carrier-protein] synthase II [Desulfonauticus submarinus]|uniref:3-oxoacyl-[acyl-carrier-protein] synthase II n=1 Tax=Desulfonauticus submarinus TaxID=206665 RepID=A0A1H0FU46_9BACT|nr:beta-ketoacyl-[acyl-carrier-protein] synthase family protein [Desulfonauticus submarinus]SDN98104.1 3-oxoacyl-[acyl-carrier-protein] synthase II [Desulfonauticus submarinus]
MNEVWIAGFEILTALGPNIKHTWDNILQKKSAIKSISRFNTTNYISKVGAYIENLEKTDNDSLLFSLLTRLLSNLPFPLPQESILLTATTKAGIDILSKNLSLEKVKQSLPFYALSWIGNYLKIKPFLNINAACASSTIAIAKGASLVSKGLVDAVIIVCFDLLSEFVHAGFSSLRALSPSACKPFDCKRQGLTLGEGGAILLLTNPKTAKKYGLKCLGTVVGWGVSNDAFHLTAPHPKGAGLVLAIKKAFKIAKINPSDIAMIHAHGTGTVYNDKMELEAFKNFFKNTPIFSLKGAIGHTLGAAGGIEVALTLKALASKIIPATIGCKEPEIEQITTENITIQNNPKYALKTNSGFGGINAALILKTGVNGN